MSGIASDVIAFANAQLEKFQPENGSEACLVSLLAFWHSRQTLCMYWQGLCSEKLNVGNGTRQGGVLSPYLSTGPQKSIDRFCQGPGGSLVICSDSKCFSGVFAWHAMHCFMASSAILSMPGKYTLLHSRALVFTMP